MRLSHLAKPSVYDEVVGIEAIELSDVRPAFWDQPETASGVVAKVTVLATTLVLVLPVVVALAATMALALGFGAPLRRPWIGVPSLICFMVTLLAVWELLGRTGLLGSLLPPASFRQAVASLLERSVFGMGLTSGWTSHRVIHDAESALDGLVVAARQTSMPMAYNDAEYLPGIDQCSLGMSSTAGDGSIAVNESFGRPSGVAGHNSVASTTQRDVAEELASGKLRRYTAGRGDTWWGLAEEIFGDGRRWSELWDLNSLSGPTKQVSAASASVSLRGRSLLLPSDRQSLFSGQESQ